MVLIPKGNRDFRGIRLVELLCKVLQGVINQWIGVEVQLHDVLHGFWSGWGMGAASL